MDWGERIFILYEFLSYKKIWGFKKNKLKKKKKKKQKLNNIKKRIKK
jgi:hypothetical protein